MRPPPLGSTSPCACGGIAAASRKLRIVVPNLNSALARTEPLSRTIQSASSAE
jgi:hypothetical protein